MVTAAPCGLSDTGAAGPVHLDHAVEVGEQQHPAYGGRAAAQRQVVPLPHRLPGRHGQDLIGAGHGHAVMFCLGRLLRAVQAIPPTFYDEFEGTGVLVHGDFGPNNVLLADDADEIVLLADWEWSTIGAPVTDLAWTEFILRMHHPDHLDCLPDLFDGYGQRPPWSVRQAAMAHRAASLEAWIRTSKGAEAASRWDYRSQCIAQWDEVA